MLWQFQMAGTCPLTFKFLFYGCCCIGPAGADHNFCCLLPTSAILSLPEALPLLFWHFQPPTNILLPITSKILVALAKELPDVEMLLTPR
jgi:hypothetical protein